MTKIGMVLDGKYEILKEIGRGGMSVVYLAMDMRVNKQWALKEMRSCEGKSQDLLLKSLRMETNVLRKVDHPVLPRIVDVIEWDGSIYVVMDYIEGRPLDEVLRTEGPRPQEQVIQWGIDLCSALDYLHSRTPPIIYRDMKPSNIMLKPDGKVKLIDFGTAKELCEDSIVDTTALGTRGYAAPEQFGDSRGRGLFGTDARTDIYSLGVTMYYMVTGKNPSEPPYVMKPIRAWDATLSSGLEKIICKCTRMNPCERYQNCEELLRDLEQYEKLDDAYRRACFQKMKSFVVAFILLLFSMVMSIVGYVGRENQRHYSYEAFIQEGFEYTVQGQYEEAAQSYIHAITEIDGRRSTAYVELLELYRNYMENPAMGLSKVTYYIEQKHDNVHKNQEVLFRVALDYFELIKDYKTSAYYFSLLNPKDYPEAVYYNSIALSMVNLDVDYECLFDSLLQFEELVDTSPLSVQKLMNYRLLCVSYAQCATQNVQALEGLQRVAEKGLNTLDIYEDDSVKAEFYTIYYQYLSLAYERLGDCWLEKETDLAKSYYSKAIECCEFMLSMVLGSNQKTLGSMTDHQLRQAKYCQMASIYENLQEYEKACEVYEKGEKEYGKNGIDLYVGHLSLLCTMEQEKTNDMERWTREAIRELYQKGQGVPGIDQDYRWKQLIQKLSPLLG